MEQRHQTKQVSATTPNQVSATEKPTRRSTLRARVARTQGYDAQAALLSPKSAGDERNLKKEKPFTVEGSGERKTLLPKVPNGKTLYFFFGYTGSKKDVGMRDQETADLEDDVLAAAAQGFKVVYDKAGTRDEFFDALYDGSCYGIYWSGHGYMNGNVQSSDGKPIRPEDVDVTRRSQKIRYLILAACGSGVGAQKWKEVLGPQCSFEGWVSTTTPAQARDFTSTALLLDSWVSHGGMNPDKELADYIQDARNAD